MTNQLQRREAIDLRHRHREEINNIVRIKGLQNVFRGQRLINRSVFVLFQAIEGLRSYIGHPWSLGLLDCVLKAITENDKQANLSNRASIYQSQQRRY